MGVTQLAWIYGMGRVWGRELLAEWEEEQRLGGPVRIFRKGKCLYTTVAVLNREMPPGRDAALYERVEAVERELAQANRRIDKAAQDGADVRRRVEALEGRRFQARAG